MKRHIAALRLIEEIACNHLCDCASMKEKPKDYYCPTCEIYSVIHGVLKCGKNKNCPSMLRGRKLVDEFIKRTSKSPESNR